MNEKLLWNTGIRYENEINFDANITYSMELLKLITNFLWTKYSKKRISGGTKNFFDEESH